MLNEGKRRVSWTGQGATVSSNSSSAVSHLLLCLLAPAAATSTASAAIAAASATGILVSPLEHVRGQTAAPQDPFIFFRLSQSNSKRHQVNQTDNSIWTVKNLSYNDDVRLRAPVSQPGRHRDASRVRRKCHERIHRSALFGLRGGSEGLKSEEYDPAKAAAGSSRAKLAASSRRERDNTAKYSGMEQDQAERGTHFWDTAAPPARSAPLRDAEGARTSDERPHRDTSSSAGHSLHSSTAGELGTAGERVMTGGSVETRGEGGGEGEAARELAIPPGTVQAPREIGKGRDQSLSWTRSEEEGTLERGSAEGSASLPDPRKPAPLLAPEAGATAISRTGDGHDEIGDPGDDKRVPRQPGMGAPLLPARELRVRRPWVHSDARTWPMAVGRGARPMGTDSGSGGQRGLAAAASQNGLDVANGVSSSSSSGHASPSAGGERLGDIKKTRVRWKPKYLTVKAVFFLFYSSLGAIMPYLPVYYHSLSLPDRRIGHLGAITPAMTFVFTPLWGALTDKSGLLKQILVMTFAASTLLRVSLAARTSYLWILSVVTLTAVINAPVRPLLDSSALQALDDRGEYGKQRLWGQWGFGIGSFLTGRLLARFGFKAAFYMHALFSVPTLLILLRFSPQKEDRRKGPPKFGELYKLMVHDADVSVFFSMVFAIGLSSGVIENFAYKRLRELGGTGSVLGISRLVSSLAGIPMFFFSGKIAERFNIVTILTTSMMSYIVRFLIYACIKNPWAGLPAEALRGVTFAGFWAASTCHIGAIAPPGLSTTMLGLLNATYGGIGQSLGSLIGGSLSMRFGTARAFVVYAGVDALLLLAFFLFKGVRSGGGARSTEIRLGHGMESSRHSPLEAAVAEAQLLLGDEGRDSTRTSDSTQATAR